VSKTLRHRLDDACRERGCTWVERPDERVSSPPYAKWWGCVYRPETGDVLVLVTDAPWKAALRRLLDRIEEPPPVVRTTRSGTAVELEDDRVAIEFEDGTREVLAHPIGVPVRRGMPVREVEFDGHEGPIVFWGMDHTPHRLTESPLDGHGGVPAH